MLSNRIAADPAADHPLRHLMRILLIALASACTLASSAMAQAPATGPLVLLLPASTRATGMGNTWVAGRDETSVFYNPAQINPTTGFGGRVVRYGDDALLGTLANAMTINWLTLGWGVQVVEFKASGFSSYPYDPSEVTRSGGTREAQSLEVVAGGNFLIKKFRTGIGLKYAEDRADAAINPLSSATLSYMAPAIHRGVVLGDVGVSHALLSGTAALAVQNIGDDSRVKLTIQTTLVWARQMQAQQLDLAFATQVSLRRDWLGAGGGVEAGWGWIEGWSAAVRAGAHRTETAAQKPIAMGATLNADHLSL
ncbi:MAG: hypothetical protein JWL61_4716, partial [Gemmatimonadetes bacterium]|nr:hypothetical protein [Gemmatimonadota bacterium]